MNIDFKSWMENLLGGFKSGGYTALADSSGSRELLKGEHLVASGPALPKPELTVREIRELKQASEARMAGIMQAEIDALYAQTGLTISGWSLVTGYKEGSNITVERFEIKLSDL